MDSSGWLKTAEGVTNSIGVSLAFIGVILAIVFYFKSRRVKQPTYSIRSAHIIQNVSDRMNLLEVSTRERKFLILRQQKLFSGTKADKQ